mmetsp:Transcript_6397/g.9290  ORF Transcript_6397/g.9290 Transcript_6397/m.9290 type:complete len:206 (+) Transcript_6397:73-690(+)
MSRAFHPPETLSKDDIRTIAQVRRDVWNGGVSGLIMGSCSGYVLHNTAKLIYNRMDEGSKRKLLRLPTISDAELLIRFNKNTLFMSVMAGGALGSFLFATVAGKNNVHNLHDIYQIGKKETTSKSNTNNEYTEDQRRRILRRETMKNRLDGARGLSDSHGGHWAHDHDCHVDRDMRRLSRRRTMKRRLEAGSGISDSHGGHWTRE